MRWPRIRSLVLMLAIAVCAPMVRVSAQSVGTVTSADTLVDGSGLNDIWLHINARDWQDLHTNYQEGTYYPVDVEWQGVKIRNSGIRVRGNTTRNDHKPSFRIDFNRYVDGQDLFGLKALVLNNSWHDPSMLHDDLSMQTFRKMGIPAPRQAHVRLYVGAAHEYAGVYVISEEISKTFLTANFGEDNGYLYEFHRQDGDNYGFQEQPELGWYIPRFGPKTHETESVANLYTPVRNLVEAVNEARQDNLEDRLGDYFDVRTFITELAVQNFLAQTDGLVGGVGMNNFYLYRFAGKKLSMLIPWDQDNSFSRMDMPPSDNMGTNVLASKIWNEPKYRDAYLARLLDIADLVSSGWLEQEAAREYEQIRAAVYEDPLTPYSRDEFDQANAFVQQFARERGAVVRQYVASIAPQVLNAGRLSVESGAYRTRLNGTPQTQNLPRR
jgi:spore coat protein CotH